MSNRTEDLARKIAEPFLEENGCTLWDVIFEKEGAMHYLRILFDNAAGTLSIDDCEKMTPPLNRLMDAQEFIKQVDILEIGSPGLTRRLRHKEHFDFCVGKDIRMMRRLDNGKTETVTGILVSYNAENKSIILDLGGHEMNLSLKQCIRVTLEEQSQ